METDPAPAWAVAHHSEGTEESRLSSGPGLLEEARSLGFPVFEVPYELPFIAITETAFSRLVNEQYDVLRNGLATHKLLEKLVLEGGPGTRGIIAGNYPRGPGAAPSKPLTGHLFNVVNVDGHVVYLDAQTGRMASAQYRLCLLRTRGARPEDAAFMPDGFIKAFGATSVIDPDPAAYPSSAAVRVAATRSHCSRSPTCSPVYRSRTGRRRQ